jgi:hypothetical protein
MGIGVRLCLRGRAGRDELLDVSRVPRGDACAQFEWLWEFAIADPTPDGGRADRQDAGLGWGGRNVCDADDAVIHFNTLCCSALVRHEVMIGMIPDIENVSLCHQLTLTVSSR